MKAKFEIYPEYKDSGVEWLDKIPQGWRNTLFKRCLSRNDGGIWNDNASSEGVLVLRSTEIDINGNWNIVNPARLLLARKEVDKYALQSGDLVVTKSSGSSNHINHITLHDKK